MILTNVTSKLQFSGKCVRLLPQSGQLKVSLVAAPSCKSGPQDDVHFSFSFITNSSQCSVTCSLSCEVTH